MSTQQEFICDFSSLRSKPVGTNQNQDKEISFKSTLLDLKKMNLQEERDSLYQQNINLQMAVKEMSEQMSLFKNRHTGVETVALLLRESKVDNIRLTKRCQLMETVIANLQNRLSSHGLSNSVNMEESEIFVPGASKQILDNLAKENARLRNQIKNTENINLKKQGEEMQSLKSTFEASELRNQSIQIEDSRAKTSQNYEAEIKPISNLPSSNEKAHYKQTQTEETDHSNVDSLKVLLSQVSSECQRLEKQLEKQQDIQTLAYNKEEVKITELKASYQKAFLETQSLKSLLAQKDNEAQCLQVRLYEMEGKIREMADPGQLMSLKNENVMLRESCDSKEAEIVHLRQEMGRLREQIGQMGREVMAKRSQPQFDASIVEILKQQIQVCTEDFNTERRDREQAVIKGKQLQEQVHKLYTEIETLKAQVETLNREKLLLQQMNFPQDSHSSNKDREQIPQLQARGLPSATQFIQPPNPMRSQGSENFSAGSSSSTFRYINQPIMSSAEPVSESTGQTFSNIPSTVMQPMKENHPFLSVISTPMSTEGIDTGRTRPGLASMPPPRQNTKDKGEYFICPKCNKEFRDSQSEDLLSHIDLCTD